MKFRSRRDNTFKFIFGGLSFLFALLIGESFLFMEFSESYLFVFDFIIASFWVLVIWIFLFTRYQITARSIKYISGPFFGSIPLHQIRKVTVNKTSWDGKKVALAKHGLIITYKKGKEIYFSPSTNDTFIEYLKQVKPSVEIEYYENYLLK